jgi:predicted ribosome quality control (RQC) complex YloA/Tae2 family protein
MFKKLNEIKKAKDYTNYRWFFSSSGTLILGGKNESQNEMVLKYFLKSNYVVMHTSSPGSPFMIIQKENPNKNDLNECAVFCACFSKEWKTGNNLINVDIFEGKDIYKMKSMKTGTFGVKNKNQIKVRPELILIVQKGKIKAVPKVKREEEILAVIKQGKTNKEEAAEKIAKKIKDKFLFPVSKEEIMMAIPSGNLNVK